MLSPVAISVGKTPKFHIIAGIVGIIVKSQIRKIVKELDKEKIIGNVAEEVEEALDKKVEGILGEAIKRAKANQRKTLQARDL